MQTNKTTDALHEKAETHEEVASNSNYQEQQANQFLNEQKALKGLPIRDRAGHSQDTPRDEEIRDERTKKRIETKVAQKQSEHVHKVVDRHKDKLINNYNQITEAHCGVFAELKDLSQLFNKQKRYINF